MTKGMKLFCVFKKAGILHVGRKAERSMTEGKGIDCTVQACMLLVNSMSCYCHWVAHWVGQTIRIALYELSYALILLNCCDKLP